MRAWQISNDSFEDIKAIFSKVRNEIRRSPLSGEDVEKLYKRIDTLQYEKDVLQAKLDDLSHIDDVITVINQFVQKDCFEHILPSVEAFAIRLNEAWPANTRLQSIRNLYEISTADNPLRTYVPNKDSLIKFIDRLRHCKLYEGVGDKYRDIVAIAKDIRKERDEETFDIHSKPFVEALVSNLPQDIKEELKSNNGIRNLQNALNK